MAFYQSSPSPRQSPYSNDRTLHASSLSRSSLLNDTLHSTQSLSGRSSIMTYKNTQYASASDALTAYISDFEHTHPLHGSYNRTVEDLLSPRSVLLRTVDRSLDTGVRDTRAEWKRYISKQLIDESYSGMVDADLAREKAQTLMESSSLLASGISPLPGGSVITETESEASVSTDALLQAPPYPQPKHQKHPGSSRKSPLRKSFIHQRNHDHRTESIQQENAQIWNDAKRASPNFENPLLKSQTIPKLPSYTSPVRRFATSHASADKDVKSKRVLFERRNLQSRGSPDKEGKGVRWTGLNGAGSQGVSNRATPKVGREMMELNRHRSPTQNFNKDGQRRQPSWIQDLNTSGVTSLVSDTQASGRAPQPSGKAPQPSSKAPPSWVQDMDMSSINGLEQDGRRPPPSWIQDLDLTLASKQHGQIYASSLVNQRSHELSEERFESRPLPLERNLRSSSASDLLTSESHSLVPPTSVTNLNPNRRITGSTDRKRSKGHSTRVPTHKKDEKYHERAVHLTEKPSLTRADSVTTDDLILASPTGKGFHVHVPSHNTRGQYSQQSATSPNYLLLNAEHRVNGYEHAENYSMALRGNMENTHRPLRNQTNSYPGELSSTPKYTVHVESDALGQSLRTELGNGGRYASYRHREIATHQEVDQQSEDILLERAGKVLHAARASQNQATHSPHYDDGTGRHDNSLLTEEILEGDRPWERNLPSHKAVKAAFNGHETEQEDHPDIVTKFLDDCLQSVSENQNLTGGYQPGPVEALKNMLFTLQGITPSNDPTTPTESPSAVENAAVRSESTCSSVSHGTEDDVKISKENLSVDKDSTSSESGTAFEDAPGGKSLQRAMEHLSRLKVLVNGSSLQKSQQSSTS